MAKGYDLTTESGTKEYLRDVEIEYQFQCLDQKEVDGCHRMAEFQENIRNNILAAAPIYKDNCDKNNYAKSCLKYGTCLDTGKGVDKVDKPQALKYYEKSCKLGNGSGCFMAAGLSIELDKDKGYQTAIALMSQACDLKYAYGCFMAASLYLQGKHVPKDLKKAFEYNQRGCNLEDFRCCNNLALMYRHGHGTEKDLTLAEELKKRAMKLSLENVKNQPAIKVNE